MIKNLLPVFVIFLLVVQNSAQNPVCKAEALAALKPIPKLVYKCNQNLDDYDEEVLTQPNRLKAISLYIKSLEKLDFADWWKTDVGDLNVCDFRRKTGALTKEQKWDYENGNYTFNLLGNNQFRVVVAQDPCYQTGFNGSNMFLLNRVGSRVFAAQIIDGFYTRADYAPRVGFAANGAEQIIEIATTSGGLYPTETYYYFTIDKKNMRAAPKNLFQSDEGKFSNRITSMMLLGEPEEYGLPRLSESLKIIVNGRLAKSFDIFNDTGETFGEDNHQKFSKQTLRWNGKFYE